MSVTKQVLSALHEHGVAFVAVIVRESGSTGVPYAIVYEANETNRNRMALALREARAKLAENPTITISPLMLQNAKSLSVAIAEETWCIGSEICGFGYEEANALAIEAVIVAPFVTKRLELTGTL